jgi:hypothetical protein
MQFFDFLRKPSDFFRHFSTKTDPFSPGFQEKRLFLSVFLFRLFKNPTGEFLLPYFKNMVL